MSETVEKTMVFEINPDMFLLQNNFNIEVYKATQSLITALAALQQFDWSSPNRFISDMDVSFVIEGVIHTELKESTEQLIYRGWIASIIRTWESYRSQMANRGFSNVMESNQIVKSVIGDLTKIRNALIHGSVIAGEDEGCRVKDCEILKWFKRGDKLTLTISHVFDFLHHLGLFQGLFTKAKQDSDADQSNLRLMWLIKRDAVFKSIGRKVVSLEDSGITDGKPDERYIHVLFDNGVFGSFYPREFAKQDSDADQSNLRLMWLIKRDAVFKSIGRKVVSLEDSGITDGKPDERYIHVLFDNGVFGSFYPREFGINSFHSVKVVEGNLKFDNKTLIKASA